MNKSVGRVAIVFRVEDDRVKDAQLSERLVPMARALTALGLHVTAVPYAEGREGSVEERLRDVAGVLVWADPLSDGGTRSGLDQLLRQARARGVWVGARPDVIDRLGTKEVLVSTRELGWGSDAHQYRDPEQLRRDFPARLAADRVRVLKATRGNGGRTVWKVRLPDDSTAIGVDDLGPTTKVLVQHAQSRDGSMERMSLAELFDQVEGAAAFGDWADGAPRGSVVDQEFIRSVTRGIVRCYLVGGRVAGFGRQYPAGVEPAGPLDVVPGTESPPEDVMGLPSCKTMYPPGEPAFADLRQRLETDWVPGLSRLLGLTPSDLPALWDIDLFIVDDSTSPEGRRYVLCEVNASSVTPSPPVVPAQVASHVATVLASRQGDA